LGKTGIFKGIASSGKAGISKGIASSGKVSNYKEEEEERL
jgi:hypothetical protein